MNYFRTAGMRRHTTAPKEGDDSILVVKGKCPVTQKEWTLEVPARDYQDWRGGMLIQKAFPLLSLDDRELLQSGITPEGWDQAFKDE